MLSTSSTTEPQPTAKTADIRLDYLDGIRALAAIYVMLSHGYATVWPFEYNREPSGMLLKMTNWLYYGHYAVTVFLVVSGFCLMIPVVRRGGVLSGGWQRFQQRRARRILPPYYAGLVLSLILAVTYIRAKTGTHWDVSIPVTTRGVLAHIFLLQNIFDKYQINHAYWSIAVEYQIYFLFPLAILAFRRLGPLPSTVIAVLLSYAWYVVDGKLGLGIVAPHFLALFVLGMLGAQVVFGAESQLTKLPWTLIAAVGTALTFLGCHSFPLTNSHQQAIDLIVGISATSLMIALAQGKAVIVSRILSTPLLVAIGGFSYSLYLIHAPLIQVLWQLIQPLHMAAIPTFLVLLIVGCPLITLLSYAFFYGFERPFLSSSHKPKVAESKPA